MNLVDFVKSSTKLRPLTRATYTSAVLSFEQFANGQPLTGALLEQWRDVRLASDTSAATVAKEMAAIKFASRRAAALGVAPNDFAAAAEFPSRNPWAPRQALDLDEYAAIEDACQSDASPCGTRDLALLRTSARGSGARRSELEALSVGSYRDPFLTLARKGGWTQVLAVDTATQAALSRWLSWRQGGPKDPLFVSLRRSVADTWVCGSRLSASGIAHAVSRRARQAGIRRRIGPHALRHTFVSMALAAGVPAHRVMESAGHRSLATTSRYAHEVNPDATPVGTAIEALLARRGELP